MLEQILCCQIARLPPIEDRVGDIRREATFRLAESAIYRASDTSAPAPELDGCTGPNGCTLPLTRIGHPGNVR